MLLLYLRCLFCLFWALLISGVLRRRVGDSRRLGYGYNAKILVKLPKKHANIKASRGSALRIATSFDGCSIIYLKRPVNRTSASVVVSGVVYATSDRPTREPACMPTLRWIRSPTAASTDVLNRCALAEACVSRIRKQRGRHGKKVVKPVKMFLSSPVGILGAFPGLVEFGL